MLGQVVHQEAGHLELVEERAALVGRAGPVGVAVEEQAEVVAARRPGCPSASSMFGRIGSGLTPPKIRVALLVDLVDPDPPAGQQPRQPAAPGAPHRVDQDRHVGGLAARRGRPSAGRTARSPRTGRTARRARPPRRRRTAAARGRPRRSPRAGASMTPRISAPAAAPVGALTLNPLSTHGLWLAVMTMPGRRAALDDLVRAHLGRHRVDREGDRDVVGEEDLGRGHREELGREAPVVGDDDALGRLATLDHVGGDAVGAAPDVVVGELVGDPGAPAIRAEHDRRRRGRLAGQRHVRSSGFGAALEQQFDGRRGRGRCRAGSRWAGRRSSYRARSGAMTPSRPPIRRTMRSSCSTSIGLARLDDRARAARAERRQQRRPRPEIGPADVHRGHHDLAVLGGALHHRVVDRDRLLDRLVGAFEAGRRAGHRPERLEEPGVAGRARRGSPGAATGRSRRSRRRPCLLDQLLGPGRLGLLLEAGQRVGAAGRTTTSPRSRSGMR